MSGFASEVVSFTLGFSPVEMHFTFVRNRFNRFPEKAGETVVNETDA